MSDKSLKSKAIDIKGKKYVLVADRVLHFNGAYKEGCITTELVSPYDSELIVMKATVYPDASKTHRHFTGYSQAIVGDGMVNKTAAMENAETSAVGRALAMMGIGVIESIASAAEMNKATNSTGMKFATEKQIKWIRDTALEVNDQLAGEPDEVVDLWVEDILTIPPQKVPIFKVKDAVDKLKEVEKDIQNKLKEELVGEDTIDLDKMPY